MRLMGAVPIYWQRVDRVLVEGETSLLFLLLRTSRMSLAAQACGSLFARDTVDSQGRGRAMGGGSEVERAIISTYYGLCAHATLVPFVTFGYLITSLSPLHH